jgi:hypothetical protein
MEDCVAGRLLMLWWEDFYLGRKILLFGGKGHRCSPISPMLQSCFGAESSLVAKSAQVAKLFWQGVFNQRHLTKEQI